MSGLDANGFTIKRLEELINDMVTRARSPDYFGPAIAAENDTPIGHMIRLVAVSLYELWELGLQLYDTRDPYAADGIPLDNLCLITGVEREPQRKSTVLERFNGSFGTVVPIGTVVRVTDGPRFVTIEAGSVPLIGFVDLNCEAEEYGPIEAPAGTINELVTLIAGITSVTNPNDAAIGRFVESNEDLRIRREIALRAVGAGTDQAIRARVDDLDEVDAVNVISNRTLYTDSYGIPGKAFLTVIWPDPVSDPEAVAEAIWEVMPAGIRSYGTEEFIVTDEQGYPQFVAFSYATELILYMEFVIGYSSAYEGDNAVKDAAESIGESLSVGDDVRLLEFLCGVSDDVLGIVSMEVRAKFGSAPGPGDTSDLPVDIDEIATLDQTNIAVSSSPI